MQTGMHQAPLSLLTTPYEVGCKIAVATDCVYVDRWSIYQPAVLLCTAADIDLLAEVMHAAQ